MHDASIRQRITTKYTELAPLMDERLRRRWAASEAIAIGWGGVQLLAAITGLSPTTIRKGRAELADQAAHPDQPISDRLRRPGAGRKRRTEEDAELLPALERLVDPVTRGDPESPLRWTCKSTRTLARELTDQGHPVSDSTVRRLLHAADYSLQGNRKTREGSQHPDRNAQFENINHQVRCFQDRDHPAISVDTKKKEILGDFKNGGREWNPQGRPELVRVHDFIDKALGKAIPYGVYDVGANEGWVNVGIDHDTARFAAMSIRGWWLNMGRPRYPKARRLLITADGGGSNSFRCRLWKVALQDLATEFELKVQVCHFPPGTSKWNKIEHRMFCHITRNWRGRPLLDRQTVVNLIADTTTEQGLTIRARLDEGLYPKGIEVSGEELETVCLKPDSFHGDWNYTITPGRTRK
jgi:Rhodopirellula transposase DDE domain